MKLRTIATAVLLATTGLIAPVKAQEPATVSPPTPTTQPQTTREQVANACIQNQAETLPAPFSDVSPNHWAFKAVMTMYYCGAFRQAAPPSLFQQVKPTQSQLPNPAEDVTSLSGGTRVERSDRGEVQLASPRSPVQR